jgi:hypothetical protein
MRAASRDSVECIESEPLRRDVAAVLLLLAVVLPLLRETGARTWQTVWAEDGTVYFTQARTGGAVLRGFAGYLQLPPRLLGAVTPAIPLRALPVYFALSGVIVAALLAWFTYVASRQWIDSPLVRLALSSLVVLMPALGYENTANITNTIWVFAGVAPWAIVSLADRPRDVLIRGLVVFLAATSTVLAIVYIPLAIGNALIRKTRAASIVAALFLAGISIQAIVILHTGQDPATARSLSRLADLFGVRVFAMFLVGDKGIEFASPQSRLLTIISTIVVIAIFVVLMRGATRSHQVLASVFLAYALITFAVPVWARGTSFVVPLFHTENAAAIHLRFSVIPVLLLSSAAAVLLAPSARPTRSPLTRIGRILFVAHIAILTVIGFSVTNLRSSEVRWATAITNAYTHCAGAPSDKIVTVRTANVRYMLLYPVPLPCRDLSP